MSKKYVIGVDIGTQGTKAGLWDISGRPGVSAFIKSSLVTASGGTISQRPEEILDSVLDSIRQIVLRSGIQKEQVVGIGIDAQMAGIMGIDEKYNAVTYYDSWLDTGCSPYVELMKKNAEEKIIRTTGCPVTVDHGPKMLWWMNERKEVYDKIDKFVVLSAFAAGKLAGLKSSEAYIDHTQLHFSGFGDVKNLEWSDELIREFGLDRSKLPRIVKPWEIIGGLIPEYAEHTGLTEGIPIVAGCGDQAASSLGAGITDKGMVFDVAGTASVLSCCVDTYKPDTENKTIIYARSVLEDLWIPLAYISGGGLCLKWFKENFADPEISYKELDHEASKVSPGSSKLIFMPHMGGRTCPADPSLSGAWTGLSWSHTRAHMYRSIMESISYEYRMYLDILKTNIADISFKEVIAVGGGSISPVFRSIKADVLGINYTALDIQETATLGSAAIAAYAAGLTSDLAACVRSMTRETTVTRSNPENKKIYEKYAAVYKETFDPLSGIMKKLKEI